ncbi:MAG TPA: TIGR04551 family protein [Anaeromyxobacteraceae bacterium]|nr:TIGR04551 family protein [Anaeromyxobacteraceae bacterium]
MRRLLVAVLASLSVLPAAAQEAPRAPAPAASGPSATTPPGATPPAATPPASTAPSSAAPADAAAADAVRREIDKAKQELRDEIRAEMQAQQSAREFLGSAQGEKRKLDFVQLDGYLRFRTDLFSGFDLGRGADPQGFFLFPRPTSKPTKSGTLTNVNARLRLDPTLNVSEEVRVHAQADVLDNIVLGSNPDVLFQAGAMPIPLGSRSQVPPSDGFNADRDSIRVKRAWAEVETPVGLLSFGRQPASWGLGILDNPGDALDDDFGDNVDRIQFAIPLRSTPIGPITVIPLYDLIATGLTTADFHNGRGIGQPIDADQSDDATALGFKVVRVDTADERDEKLERGRGSFNYGLYYNYRSQGYAFPAVETGQAGQVSGAQPVGDVGPLVRRAASAHVFDLWTRYQTKKYRLELEATGIIGEISNAAGAVPNPTTGEGGAFVAEPAFGPVLIRQFGAVAQGEYALGSGRWKLGSELGVASGDSAPGFGNRPERGIAQRGSIDGRQFGLDGDRDLRNFRFNPAYRVDLILWREIIGQVTDAWYLKPTLKYSFIDGLDATASVIYSQSLYETSTPAGNHKSLGIEADVGLSYRSDDGFVAWLDYGVMQPLAAFNGAGDTTRAHAIRTGLAVRF